MRKLNKKRSTAKFLYKKKGSYHSKLVLIALPVPYLTKPAMNPPLGLSYIAAFTKDVANTQAIDFATINCDFETSDYLKHIPLDGDIYIISCDTPQYGWLKQVGIYLKKFTKVLVAAQGRHPTNSTEECLNYVDVIIKGTGEIPARKLILETPLECVKGIAYKKEGQLYKTEAVTIHKLDRFPFPDRDVFDFRKYKSAINGKKAVHIITMRGCSYRCYTCDKPTVGRAAHFRSIGNVMEEIDTLRAQGFEAFVIDDDVFTIGHERVREFCKEFKKRKIIWRCQSRIDTVTWELLRTMAEAGLSDITYNVKTGDTQILKKINRGDKEKTLPNTRRALLWAHLAHIPVRCNLQYGLPGETIKSLRHTVRLIFKTYPDEVNLSIFQPAPGSAIWRNPKKFGVTIDFKKMKEQNYLPISYFNDREEHNCVTLNTMTPVEYWQNLKWFTWKLDSVCRRRKIKDTL